MYLNPLNFAHYRQVESLVSNLICDFRDSSLFRVTFPSIQRLSSLDNGQGLPTLKTF